MLAPASSGKQEKHGTRAYMQCRSSRLAKSYPLHVLTNDSLVTSPLLAEFFERTLCAAVVMYSCKTILWSEATKICSSRTAHSGSSSRIMTWPACYCTVALHHNCEIWKTTPTFASATGTAYERVYRAFPAYHYMPEPAFIASRTPQHFLSYI